MSLPKSLVLCLSVLLAGCPKPPPPPTLEEIKAEADGHYLAATTAYLKGDFVAAQKEFDEVKKLAPNDPRLPAAEGELVLSSGRLDEAAKLFEAAVKLDPKRATNYSRLGYIYSAKGDHDHALEVLNKALELNARDFNAYESRAEIAFKKGDVAASVKDLLSAGEIAPEKLQAGFVAQAVKQLLDANKKDEALVALQAADQRGVKASDLFEQEGALLVENKKFPEAVIAYTKAAELAPKDPTLWEIAGELEFKQGHLKEAETAYKKSIAIQDRAVVHAAIARMCQANKMKDCVATELDKALATASGEEPRELFDLSDLLASEGRKKDALLLLKQLSEEPTEAKNADLHLKVAALAKELKDTAVVTEACARALKASKPGTRCP